MCPETAVRLQQDNGAFGSCLTGTFGALRVAPQMVETGFLAWIVKTALPLRPDNILASSALSTTRSAKKGDSKQYNEKKPEAIRPSQCRLFGQGMLNALFVLTEGLDR